MEKKEEGMEERINGGRRERGGGVRRGGERKGKRRERNGKEREAQKGNESMGRKEGRVKGKAMKEEMEGGRE